MSVGRVVVVGAGVAGLSTESRLSRVGARVNVSPGDLLGIARAEGVRWLLPGIDGLASVGGAA